MNLILITSGNRPEYLKQTLASLRDNAADWSKHTLTLVFDTSERTMFKYTDVEIGTWIVNRIPQGASASRNIGAGSIPKYRRQKHVMFVDDDVYACPGWDQRLEELWHLLLLDDCKIISGHAHPFNHDVPVRPVGGSRAYRTPLLVSTVHMVMPWTLWDDVGYFVEPGGPGGSEDYDYCMRAAAKGYGFAVTDPHCMIHCGLTSSRGQQIVGYDLMREQNAKLIELYGLQGKVIFG